MKLNRILASAVLAVAAGSTIPVMAQGAPKLSEGEKATLKSFHAFNGCLEKVQEKAINQAKAIADARAGAGDKATLDSLKASGVNDELAKNLTGALGQVETKLLAQALMQISGDPRPVCAKETGVGNDRGFSEAFKKALDGLTEKYGEEILEPEEQDLPIPTIKFD